AYVEHKLYAQPQPTKVYYLGPMFRYANVQAGRDRQVHQFGAEVFGSSDPAVDAEVIAMAMDFYHRLGLKDLELHINSVGCPACRSVHREELHKFLESRADKLCKLCQGRFERNPLRILDCKEEACRDASLGAPTTTTCLCPECAGHFRRVKSYLDSVGIKYIVNDRLVRGLDYYTNTAFEIMAPDIGAQSSIGGGGRYNGLIEQVGGPSTPGIGYALGLERVLATMERQGVQFPGGHQFDVFIAALGDAAKERAFTILNDLRQAGLAAEMDYMGRSLRAQMKYAGKFDTGYTVIIGDEELNRGVAVLRDMAAGTQEEVALDNLREMILTKKQEEKK
ncbi:histidine--tRNA ligase, partial [bacterium]